MVPSSESVDRPSGFGRPIGRAPREGELPDSIYQPSQFGRLTRIVMPWILFGHFPDFDPCGSDPCGSDSTISRVSP